MKSILLSNDDGVYAPGLVMLAETLGAIAKVDIVAPDRDRSGASNSLTLDRPLRARKLENGFVMVDGTPTDCVHLAITGLLQHEPDMVVSGINSGANLGDDVLYSGTVAAALEGRFLGYPAIAVSMTASLPRHYKTGAIIARMLVERLRTDPLPKDTILNVNVPDLPFEQLCGFVTTRLGHRHRAEPIVQTEDPRGRAIYWVGPAGGEQDAGEGTDFYAINQGKVSLTPIQVDLTRHTALDTIAEWVKGLGV